MAIAGWIVAAVVAYIFAKQAQPLILEIPLVSNFLKGSCELSIVAAYCAVFAVALIVMGFFTPLFSTLVQRSVYGSIDQGLGFFFGVARGLLLVAVAFLVYEKTMANETIAMVQNSRSIAIFSQFQTQLMNEMPQDAPGWIVARYEGLVSDCGAPPADATPTRTSLPPLPVADSSAPATDGTTGTGTAGSGNGGSASGN